MIPSDLAADRTLTSNPRGLQEDAPRPLPSRPQPNLLPPDPLRRASIPFYSSCSAHQRFPPHALKAHRPYPAPHRLGCFPSPRSAQVEAAKAPKERRPPPPPPPELDQPLPTTSQGMDEFNSKMFAYYNGVSLMPCPNCGRTMRWVTGGSAVELVGGGLSYAGLGYWLLPP
jgi:hypothetical protein